MPGVNFINIDTYIQSIPFFQVVRTSGSTWRTQPWTGSSRCPTCLGCWPTKKVRNPDINRTESDLNYLVIGLKLKRQLSPEHVRTVLSAFLDNRYFTTIFRSMSTRGVYTRCLHEVSTRSIYTKWTPYFSIIFAMFFSISKCVWSIN